MGHPVVHFQIGAKEDEATAAFYSELFGWGISPVAGMPYHNIQTGSPLGIQGGIARVNRDSEAVVTFYVEVENVAEVLNHAESLGAKILMPATEVLPFLVLGQFQDPEGRTLGVSQHARPQAALPTESSRRNIVDEGARSAGKEKGRKGKGKSKGSKGKKGKDRKDKKKKKR